MKCDKCGTELLKGNTIEAATDVVHSDSRCIDAIRAQLASMTKRAEDAEAKLMATLIGAGAFRERIVEIADDLLGLQPADAPTLSLLDDIDRWAHEERIRAGAAEAKLAAAQSELKVAWSDCHDGLCHACAKCYDAAEARLAMAVEGLTEIQEEGIYEIGVDMARLARNALRALGIDPSKEQGK